MSAPFRHRLRVRYSDCDPQGVVFNANYLAYFDIGLTELWRETMGSWSATTDAGYDMVVAEARLVYRAPARFDDEVDVEISAVRLGTTSMSSSLAIRRGDDTLVEGEMRHVFVDLESRRKTEIPAFVREALAPWTA